MSSSTKLSTVSRRASTALPVLPPTHRLAMRRDSVSTPSTGGDLSVNEQPVAFQHAHVGEGALDDSESSSGSEGSAPAQTSLTHEVAGSQGGPQASSSAIAKQPCDPAPPRGLLLKVPAPREDSPDERDEEGSVSGYDTDTSDESRSPSPASPSSSESAGRISPSKLSQALNQKHEQPGQVPAPVLSGHRGTSMAYSQRSLTQQKSQNSMRTVTVAPSDTASVYAPSIDRVSLPDPAADDRMAVAEGMSTRRPSPHHHRAVSATVPALGLSNMDDTRNMQTSGLVPSITYPTRLSEEQTRQIMEDEAHLRQIGWKALRENFDWFAEKGDVQLCALLAIVAPVELHVSPVRATRFFEAYIGRCIDRITSYYHQHYPALPDILSRMQLHTLAAHLRKHVPYDAIRAASLVQTTLYPSCGQCGSHIRTNALGGPVLCEKCKSLPTLCAVCHVPVRKLLIHCATCGHGGHQACYREFYLARPLTELPTHAAGAFPYGTMDSYSSTDTSSATYYSFSDSSEHAARGEDAAEDDDDSEQDGSGGRGSDKDRGKEELREYEASTGNNTERRPNMRILGHACAAGCGHWCWAANERFTGT
ncbi:hypothetical protein JB92DRAFT_1977542 [Gautieria morchelliformis]|nr:hypothetical protein JB92DRAFT_1977542 [Gautieria morchelliformis]